MELNEYQTRASETAIYPVDRGLTYVALGLAEEAGEVAGKLKKAIRDDGGEITESRREQMIKEVGDVLWYVSQVAFELGIGLEEVARRNLSKLADRAERGVIGGSGDER